MTPMPLHEAIRLGAMTTHQIFNAMRLEVEGDTIGTCALGAAYVAGGLTAQDNMMEHWPILKRFNVCPVAGCLFTRNGSAVHNVARLITHLNDNHRWTREHIANWVESITLPTELPQPELEVEHGRA